MTLSAKPYLSRSVAVKATPMTRLEYNEYRNWQLPGNENPSDEGFLVETASDQPNDDRHEGYINWLPKKQFDSLYYSPTNTGLNFGQALELVKQGNSISRAGWNGKDLSVFYVKESHADNGDTIAEHFWLRHARSSLLSSWVPSNNDCFATDWQVVAWNSNN